MRDMYQSTKKITDEQVYEAAHFFSANYGIWGRSAVENMGSSVKAGKQVTISCSNSYNHDLYFKSQ